ncbi:MAG: hypothetical protein ACMUIP_11745 [bacterium]
MKIGYRNRYYYSDSASSEDSVSHEGFLNLDKWFIRQFGISFTSSVNRGKFKAPHISSWHEDEDNFYQSQGELMLNYRWSPSGTLFTKYGLLYQDFDKTDQLNNASDYRTHQGIVGLELALRMHTAFGVVGGYFKNDLLNSDNGEKKEGSIFSAILSIQSERSSLSIEGSGGYAEDYFSSENLG